MDVLCDREYEEIALFERGIFVLITKPPNHNESRFQKSRRFWSRNKRRVKCFALDPVKVKRPRK